MQLKKVSDYSLRLDFSPIHQAALGGIAHAARGVLISGFQLTPDCYVIDHGEVSPSELTRLWQDLYPELTLPEKCRLLTHPEISRFEPLMDVFPKDPDFKKLAQKITSLNLVSQNWLSDKNFGLKELLVFLDLETEEVEKTIATSQLFLETRQMAAQRFEWTQELKLMGNSFNEIFSLKLEQLKALRFPHATSREIELKSKTMNWPQKIRAKANRRNDQLGFDVQFFAGTPVELEKISEQLKKVAITWNSDQNLP